MLSENSFKIHNISCSMKIAKSGKRDFHEFIENRADGLLILEKL